MTAPSVGESRLKAGLRLLLAVAMVTVGVLHFVRPSGFVKIVPPWLPAQLTLVLVSGFFEVLGGVGLLVKRVQRAAAWGLVALYVAVFPANIHMAVNAIQPDGVDLPAWAAWARLPFQVVFVAWAVWLARDSRARRAHP